MTERGYCPWCADEAFDPRACTCPHDCGITGCAQSPKLADAATDGADDDWDDEPCYHEHDEECEDEQGYLSHCHHQHCFACGGCQCPGYCDDYQTYNLRPPETGGA